MSLRPFALERYFGRYEFSVRHLLCASDCESRSIGELLELAGADPSVLTELGLGYTESQGDPELRAAIAGLYDSVGPDRVVVTNAPEEAIFITMTALVGPGDRVVVLTPCYQSLIEVARHRGAQVDAWPLAETAGGWALDLERLERLLAEPVRLVVVNFPHNPTGFQASREELEAVVELTRRAGARLFSDEMYRGLEHAAPKLPSAADLDRRALALCGTSKSYGLPGLRLGWLALGDGSLVARLLETKDYTTICSSAPSELLARLALGVGEELVARNLALVRDNLAATQAFLERWPELLDWRAPAAGPLAFPRLRSGSATAFCDRARREAEVLLVPSPIFDHGDSHLRWGMGRRSFGEALEALEAWLEHR